MNKIVFEFLALALVLPFAAAQNCWEEHDMPLNTWSYSAWLCISGSNHGWIYSVGPTGHPSAGRMFKVELHSFTYSSPYPATLYCYEQFTDIDPPSMLPPGGAVSARTRGGGGTLNSIPQGPLYSWHYAAQVTLNAGDGTVDSSAWVQYGCPPIKNLNQMGGSPPQVQIQVNWNGWPGANKHNAAISAIDYTAVGTPFYGVLDGFIDARAWQTAVLKAKRVRC